MTIYFRKPFANNRTLESTIFCIVLDKSLSFPLYYIFYSISILIDGIYNIIVFTVLSGVCCTAIKQLIKRRLKLIGVTLKFV